MKLKALLITIIALSSTHAIADYTQFASCKGHTIDGESLIATIESNDSNDGKALIKIDIKGLDALYSNTRTEISEEDELSLHIFKNRFGMDFLLDDESRTTTDIKLDGRLLARNVKCFVNSSQYWPRHGLSMEELKDRAFKFGNAIAIALGGELDRRCLGLGSFNGGHRSDEVSFNIPFGEYEEEYGECNGDPHNSIDVNLTDDGSLLSVHHIDA